MVNNSRTNVAARLHLAKGHKHMGASIEIFLMEYGLYFTLLLQLHFTDKAWYSTEDSSDGVLNDFTIGGTFYFNHIILKRLQ